MTTKLIWRLKEQPTTESLRELVKDQIITKEEAREILMTHTDVKEEKDKEALKAEVNFLRETVEKLSENKPFRIIETIREVERPYRVQPWYKPYEVWCNNLNTVFANDDGQAILKAESATSDIKLASFASLNNFSTN